LKDNFLFRKTLGLFVKTKGLLSRPILGGLGHIFMLHRVLPESLRNLYIINRDLAITPEFLEESINFFRGQGYVFLSLDEVSQILSSGHRPKHKFICFTLDDGYRDNLEFGFPIFQKLGVPITIYVTNCFPNSTAILWWYMLEKVILEQKSFQLNTPQGVKKLEWNNESDGLNCFHQIRNTIRQLPKAEFRTVVLDAFGTNESDLLEMNKGLFLSWDEIRQLSTDSLVTIGAHTMNHLSLSSLSNDEIEFEVLTSKFELEQHISKPVNHFAYPYGGKEDAYQREYQMISRMGFKTATLNIPGNIFQCQAAHQECLPRIPFGNSTSKEKIHQILTGINHFSNNGFKRTFND
jgi:peptidoglycan/xylan/chitin deacetylase (PgdA/CDA1 family)